MKQQKSSFWDLMSEILLVGLLHKDKKNLKNYIVIYNCEEVLLVRPYEWDIITTTRSISIAYTNFLNSSNWEEG